MKNTTRCLSIFLTIIILLSIITPASADLDDNLYTKVPLDMQPTNSTLLDELTRQGIDKEYVTISQDYGIASEGKSPYTQVYADTKSNKKFAMISQLPMVDAYGIKIKVNWFESNGVYYNISSDKSLANNLFWAEVRDGQIIIINTSDQPDGSKTGDNVVFTPQLFVDGKEIFPVSTTPILLAVDPVNPNYHNNTLEWDYGVCQRRVRLIEGRFLGSWVFSANPKDDVLIKYNQASKIRLKLQYARDEDTEFIPKAFFDEAQEYPVAIADSATFYPDADPETSSVDGHVYQITSNVTWSTIVAAAGTNADPTGNSAYIRFDAGTTSERWNRLYRLITLFDTSSLPDTANISSAILSLRGQSGKTDGCSATPSINVYSSNPASNNNLVSGDYATLGASAFCNAAIAYADWLESSTFNDFALNASGIAAINTAGVSKFGFRLNYDVTDTAPNWVSGGSTYLKAYTVEKGEGYQPTLVVTYTIGGTAPTVVTNNATNIEETTTTLSLNITATSPNATSMSWMWDTDSGTPYANIFTNNGSFGVGNYTHNINSLSLGTLYYVSSNATNTEGTGNGTEKQFLTKPNSATNFHSTNNDTSWIFLEWTNGDGMDIVGIRYDTGSAPTDNVTGTQGFWGTGTSTNITGLSSNTTYFFRIDTYAFEDGFESQADSDIECQDKTNTLTIPTVTTGATTLVEETTARLNGEITGIGSGNVTETRFQWGTTSGIYTNNNTQSANDSTTTFYYDLSELTEGEAYYYITSANNSAGWGYGSEQKFLTKPKEPTGIAPNGNVGEIYMEWNPADGADKYMVRGKLEGYPTDYADGNEVYFGTDNMTTHTGLGNNETWYYKIWSYCAEDGMEQWSDSYTFGAATTDIIAPTVTQNAATGITDNDATLPGTITDDGGSVSCNGTWFYGLTDEGQTTGWDASANQIGLTTGTISQTVSDSLMPSTTYYWIIRIVNEAGTGWSIGGNFTTTAIPAILLPPTNLTLIDLGSSSVNITWTIGTGATHTLLRVSRTSFPKDTTDGEELYFNTGNTTLATGWNLDITTYYISAWSYNGTDYSTESTRGSIGGDMIFLGVLIFLSASFTISSQILKKGMLAFAAGAAWMITSIQCFIQSSTPWDTFFSLGFLFIGLTLVCSFSPMAWKETTPPNETTEDPDTADMKAEMDEFNKQRNQYNFLYRRSPQRRKRMQIQHRTRF